MKNIVRVRVKIYQIRFEDLVTILKAFPAIGSKIKVDYRVIGDEIGMEDEAISFYCYSALDGQTVSGEENYLIDVFCRDIQMYCIEFVNNFANHLEINSAIFDLEYVQEDESGKAISDETSIFSSSYHEYIKNRNLSG